MLRNFFVLAIIGSLSVEAQSNRSEDILPEMLDCTYKQSRNGHGGTSSWTSNILIKRTSSPYLPSMIQTITDTSTHSLSTPHSKAYVTKMVSRGENLFFVSGQSYEKDSSVPSTTQTVVVSRELDLAGSTVWFASTIQKNESWGDQVYVHICETR